MDNARISQAVAEALAEGESSFRVSQAAVETVDIGDANVRLTQVVLEVVAIDAANAKLTQVVMEAVFSSTPPPTFPVFVPRPIVITPEYVGVRSPAPSIGGIEQDGSAINVYVVPSAHTGDTPAVSVALYRGPFSSGPWTLVDSVMPDPLARINKLTDSSPPIGTQSFYVAAVFDATGTQSKLSSTAAYSARQLET